QEGADGRTIFGEFDGPTTSVPLSLFRSPTKTRLEASENTGNPPRRAPLFLFTGQEGRKDGRFFGSSTVEPDAILASGSHHGGESRRRDRKSIGDRRRRSLLPLVRSFL